MKTEVSGQRNSFRQFALPAAAFIALAVLSLLLSQAAGIARNFVKLLFEGNSFGKTFAFFAFEIALLALLALFAKLKWKPKASPQFYLKIFFACILLLWVAGYGAEYWLFSQQGTGIGGYVGTLYAENGFTSWEATYLQHNHSNKVAVAELLSVFGMQKSQGIDTGLPLYNIFPFSHALGILVLVLTAILLVSGLLFTLARFGKTDRWFWLWNLAFFAGFVQAIDGGLFSIVGINFAGLSAIFLAREFWEKRKTKGKEKTHKYLDNAFSRLVLVPLLAMLEIALILQGLAGTWFWENHGMVVLLAGLALFALEKNKKNLFWAALGAIALAILLFPWVSGFASNSLVRSNATIYIYPSEGKSAKEWNSAFGGIIEVGSAEDYGNFAVLHASASEWLTTEDLKEKLASQGESHYYDIEIAGEKRFYELMVPAKSIEKFRNLDSDSFKTVLVREEGARGKVVVESRASPLMTLLFGLNIEQSSEVPEGKSQAVLVLEKIR